VKSAVTVWPETAFAGVPAIWNSEAGEKPHRLVEAKRPSRLQWCYLARRVQGGPR